MIEIMDVAAHVTEELIPSMLERIELGFVTEMPFAEYAASISCRFEGRRKYGLLRRQAELPFFCQFDCLVVTSHVASPYGAFQAARPLLISPCKQGSARGTALRTIGVMLSESHAFLCQTVDPGSLSYGVTITTEISVTEVVCKNKHYVGWFICKSVACQNGGEE